MAVRLAAAGTPASDASAMDDGTKIRCGWATSDLDVAYHDTEWGVPAHDDRVLFEFLVLEGAQAGLSWATILKKRPHYRRAFAGFDPARVARFTRARTARLLRDPGIVRNRAKIEGAIANARAFVRVQREMGSFDRYLWEFVGGVPRQNRWRTRRQVPSRTRVSDALSDDLRARGFTFVGSTICYAYMQAVGLVNDHVVSCHRHAELAGAKPITRSWASAARAFGAGDRAGGRAPRA